MIIMNENIIVVLLIIFSLILINEQVRGKFLSTAGSSSIIVLRHLRLPTDYEYYRVRCPYNLNHLTVTLLNYSNEDCFQLYSTSMHNVCPNRQSPCRFFAKALPLNCHSTIYSAHVDISYQCSLSSSNQSESQRDSTSTPSSLFNPITLHSLSFSSQTSPFDETLAMFLIGLLVVLILWLTVCCTWFVQCHQTTSERQTNQQCQLMSPRSHSNIDQQQQHHYSMIAGNLAHQTGRLENVTLSVNPFDKNKHIESHTNRLTIEKMLV